MGESFLDRLAKPARPNPAPFTRPAALGRDTSAYARAALEGEVEHVRNAPEGQRNHTLNKSAFKLAALVLSGDLTQNTVDEHLTAAALTAGLDPVEIGKTLASAHRSQTEPRVIPDREAAPWEQSDDPFADHYVAPSTGLPVTASPTAQPAAAQAATTAAPAGTVEGKASSTGDAAAASDSPDLDALVRERLPLIDWHELWNDASDEEWIVYPIVPARRLVALYSAPKVGKSLLCLELAVAVSQGERVLGWQPERPRRVLYVDFENDPRGDIRARLQAMGHEPDDLANLCYLSFPTLAGLDSEQGAAELVAASQVYDCEVIVIDTVSRSVDGDENENDTWLAFYRHTGLKLKQLGVSMIRLDHAGKDETKGQRGGSAKEGDVDAVWRMQRLTDGADGGDEAFRLTCTHNRFQLSPGDKVLDIIRHAAPLHHTIRAAGARDLIVDAIVAYLDSIDAPVADGYRKYSVDELKRSGIPGASQRTLSDAIDRRRRRASWDDDNDGDDA